MALKLWLSAGAFVALTTHLVYYKSFKDLYVSLSHSFSRYFPVKFAGISLEYNVYFQRGTQFQILLYLMDKFQMYYFDIFGG
jgi:hypothetical protein